jgi:hypothetical protein
MHGPVEMRKNQPPAPVWQEQYFCEQWAPKPRLRTRNTRSAANSLDFVT